MAVFCLQLKLLLMDVCLYLCAFCELQHSGGENQVAINLIVKHVHLKLQEVLDAL